MNRSSFKISSLLAARSAFVLAGMLFSCLSSQAALPAPTFSPAGGIFTENVKLTISAKGGGAIHYTLDGAEPTEASPVYASPIHVTNTVVVKARCFAKGQPPGPAAGDVFALVDESMADFDSNLPLVIIHNVNGRVNAKNAAPCFARILVPNNKGRTTLTGAADYQGFGTVKRRGRSSLDYPKNSFTFHTVDAAGEPLNVPLLGMPKESAWILYAPYPDKTLMRDVLAYDLSNKMGRYAPRTRFVELFVSRPGAKISRRSYAGVYVLEEKVKRDKNRVNIAKLTPEHNKEPEVTGGYIFKKDHSDKGEPGFRTSRGSYFYFDTPKAEEITREQRSYLVGYLNKLEAALYGSNFRDPQRGYAAYLDVDSLIDHHWIVEFSKNVDGIRFSNFLHKDRNGKIKMEPIWDWNLSFGNASGKNGWVPEEWYGSELRSTEYLWFPRLFEDPDFEQKYIDRWGVLRTNVFAASNVLARIDEIASELNEAQARNFKRWPVMGRFVHPNYYVGKSYADEVRWMKNWIRLRIAWIDRQFVHAPSYAVGKGNSRQVSLSATGGKIYYTLNGSDPRLPGGKISPDAKVYTGPVNLDKHGKLLARVYSSNRWSSPTLVQ